MLREPNATLTSLLAQYEEYGGLVLSWINLASSGHIMRPSSVLQAFTACEPETSPGSHIVKTIANTRWAVRSSWTHQCIYHSGKHAGGWVGRSGRVAAWGLWVGSGAL